MTFSIKNFKQYFQVQYIDKLAFETNPTKFVNDYYQTDNHKYTSMGVINTIIHVKISRGKFDIIEGLIVYISVKALIYRPVIGSTIAVLVKPGKSEFIGSVLTDNIKSSVRLIEEPISTPATVYPCLIKYINVISWQCQIMDKLIIIGKLA